MSITSTTTRKAGPFTCNGSTTVFPFTFKVFADADLLVTLTNALGVATTQALTTQYTVVRNDNQDVSPGGSVTMLVAPPATYTLTVTGVMDATQPLVLTNTGGFYPTVINDAFDRCVILIQQVIESVSRALRLPIGIGSNVSPTLPFPSASTYLGWNSTGTALVNYSPSSGTGSAGADAVTGVLTLPTVALPADSAGVVSSYATATGTFKVYSGSTDVTASCTFAIYAYTASLASYVTINAAGVYAVTNGLTADSGYVTFRATYGTAVLQATFTLTKSKAGQQGVAGSGSNAVYVDLSRAAGSVAAYADGSVGSYAGLNGLLRVFDGASDVTSASTLSASASNCTGTINTAASVPVSAQSKGYYEVTAMSADTGTLTLSAVYGGITYTRTFSVSKLRVGYEIVGALPTTNLFNGRMVFLTTTAKLYRYDGTVGGLGWTTAVPSTDITGTLTDAQIAALAAAKLTGTITETQIDTDAVTSPKIKAGAIVAGKLATNSVLADNIAAFQITSDKIASNTITALQIASGTITSDRINVGNLVAAFIGTNQLTALNIQAGAIKADQLDTDAVTTNKIQANAVTASRIDSRGLTIKDNLGNVVFSAGVPLVASYITPAAGWLNSNVTLTGIGYTGATDATKNTVYRQTTAPASGMSTNDLWFNTSTFATYYYDGATWVLAGDRTSSNTAAAITGQGAFATLNQITNLNATTYIASAAIGNAQIADLNATKITAGTIRAAKFETDLGVDLAAIVPGALNTNLTVYDSTVHYYAQSSSSNPSVSDEWFSAATAAIAASNQIGLIDVSYDYNSQAGLSINGFAQFLAVQLMVSTNGGSTWSYIDTGSWSLNPGSFTNTSYLTFSSPVSSPFYYRFPSSGSIKFRLSITYVNSYDAVYYLNSYYRAAYSRNVSINVRALFMK